MIRSSFTQDIKCLRHLFKKGDAPELSIKQVVVLFNSASKILVFSPKVEVGKKEPDLFITYKQFLLIPSLDRYYVI
jgi:hypothetical protein